MINVTTIGNRLRRTKMANLFLSRKQSLGIKKQHMRSADIAGIGHGLPKSNGGQCLGSRIRWQPSRRHSRHPNRSITQIGGE